MPEERIAGFSSCISSDSGAFMRAYNFGRLCHPVRTTVLRLMMVVASVAISTASASAESVSAHSPADPFEPVVVQAEQDPFETELSDTPINAAAYVPVHTRHAVHSAHFQAPATVPPQQPALVSPQQPEIISQPPGVIEPQQPVGVLPEPGAPANNDPCAAARFRPIGELGIGIAAPTGKSPTDFATPCWDQINAGPSATCRCWPVLCYRWDATNLCYRPLYFEEINAERYGYICDDCCCCCLGPQDCVQSAASAAHFFATIPALPYCLSAEPPHECVYTLGHYRPGSCVPWRHNYPPCDPWAALTTAGVYTGLVFAIP
jgi:hypothetical protein